MTHPNIADATVITEEQARSLRLQTLDFSHVDVRIVAGRAAIVHVATSEPVQFLTVTSASHVKWLAESWSMHFETIKRRAGER